MTKHLNFQEDNKTSMLSILDNGYAEIVPSVEPSIYDCMPDKLRILCDFAAVHRGISTVVLQSSDITDGFRGILPRFRLDSLAMMSDIE